MKIIPRQEAINQGLGRYFTGKPCVRGHLSERYTTSCCCVECNNENVAKERQRIAERRRERQAEEVSA